MGVLDEKEEPKFSLERIREVVAAMPLFSSLSAVGRSERADNSTLHGFKTGEMIFREGDTGRSIYVVLNGRVRVFTGDNDGNDQELVILEGGQVFAVMSFFAGEPRSAYVSATKTSMLMELSYSGMRKFIKENPTAKEVLTHYYRAEAAQWSLGREE